MSSDQSLWADFGAVEELTEQAAETISGGAEVFSIYNGTGIFIPYNLDGYSLGLAPGEEVVYTTAGNGILTLDTDLRSGYQGKSYDLEDGGAYAFGANISTVNNPYDIALGVIV
jgi:hypothetical protein